MRPFSDNNRNAPVTEELLLASFGNIFRASGVFLLFNMENSLHIIFQTFTQLFIRAVTSILQKIIES